MHETQTQNRKIRTNILKFGRDLHVISFLFASDFASSTSELSIGSYTAYRMRVLCIYISKICAYSNRCVVWKWWANRFLFIFFKTNISRKHKQKRVEKESERARTRLNESKKKRKHSATQIEMKLIIGKENARRLLGFTWNLSPINWKYACIKSIRLGLDGIAWLFFLNLNAFLFFDSKSDSVNWLLFHFIYLFS